jgi:hypothetical protein
MQSLAFLGFTEGRDGPVGPILLRIQSNPIHYTHLVELAAFSAWLSPNDLLFAEVRLRGADCAVSVLAASMVLPKDPQDGPQSPDPSLQYAAATDQAPSEFVRAASV